MVNYIYIYFIIYTCIIYKYVYMHIWDPFKVPLYGSLKGPFKGPFTEAARAMGCVAGSDSVYKEASNETGRKPAKAKHK